MTFTPVPGERYDMPVAFGPSVAPPVTEGFETFNTAIAYRTTKDAIANLLPKWFEPVDEQNVVFTYTRMVNMDWMGGRNYNIVNVLCNVLCVAGPEPFLGRYTLAIWESDAAPVIAGREYMGSPKLVGTIADVDVFASDFTFSCKEYDAELIRGEVSEMRPMTDAELQPIAEAGLNTVGLNWKYIPGLEGEPDISYPTALYMKFAYDRGARGRGTVSFGSPTTAEAPYSAKIAHALGQIPLLEHVDTVALHSAYTYLFRDQTRRLDIGEASSSEASGVTVGAVSH
jgi:Acetoacetate decarboxylase (ADC)